ncbi:MAG: hypothetical protein WCH11_04035 [Bdellovibrio sp.]
MEKSKTAVILGLGLTALLSLGCNNGSGGGGGGSSPPPPAGVTAQGYGETGGRCGREEAVLMSLSASAVCNFLKADTEVNCERNFGTATSARMSARIFLRGLKVSGSLNQIEVLVQAPGTQDLANQSIVSMEFNDGVKPYRIPGIPLKASTTNVVNTQGRVELEFEDNFGAIRLVGQYTAADAQGNGSITSGIVQGRSLGSNSATLTNYQTLGSFSIKSCAIFNVVP